MANDNNGKKRRIMIITADESLIEQIQNTTSGSLLKSFILDSNGDRVELTSSTSTSTSNSTPPTKKSKTATLTCVVCGSSANGYNFDAITCESCKAFFRRNALKDPNTMECRRQGLCDINLDSRRRCSACRLRKCLQQGMRRDRLLTTEQKAIKRREIEDNRILTSQKLQSPSSITNESGREDISSPMINNTLTTMTKPKTEMIDTVLSQFTTMHDRNLLLLNDVRDLLPETNEEKKLLTHEDLKRVETIQLSYEQRIELAERDGLPWNPSIYGHTLLQHLNGRSVSVMRLITFFKQIPEFAALNVFDRVTLVKYNLMPLIFLNCTLAYNAETKQISEMEQDAPWNPSVLIDLHGQEIFVKVKKIFDSFVRIAQYDQRIIQLALIVLILTKGFATNSSASEPILNDGIAVYRAQNYYSELLWKYIETIHGREKSIQIFNDLVVHFISWQKLHGEMQRTLRSRLTPTEINDLLPIMRSLLHIP